MSSFLDSLNPVSAKATSTADVNTNVQLEQANTGNAIFSEILAETKGDLSFINPENLREPKFLSNGTSYNVTREVFHQTGKTDYYVAVKRVITKVRTAEELQQRLDVVRRELRVLMHPHLRSHRCIAAILGQGYLRDTQQNVVPYLVMDYSDLGHLGEYFQRSHIPSKERLELAVDVAIGLRSIHDCKIIHGDIKLKNVLVFSYSNDFSERPQIAQISDFGSTIFTDDFKTHSYVRYLGTTKYNAPEVASRTGPGVKRLECSQTAYESADVYSFGLLLVEVMLNGQSFVDLDWLKLVDKGTRQNGMTTAEQELFFLDNVTVVKEDYLLELVKGFAQRVLDDADSTLVQCVTDTLPLCLRDNFSNRQSIHAVVEALTQGNAEERPPRQRIMRYTLPPTPKMGLDVTMPAKKPGTFYRMMPPTSDNLKVRVIDIDHTETNMHTTFGPVQRSTHAAYAAVKAPSTYQSAEPDFFKISITISPPWHAQVEIANRTRSRLLLETDPRKKAHLHLQLSVIYYIGYGIQPNVASSMYHLQAAVGSNDIATCIYPRVIAAIRETATEPDNIGFENLGLEAQDATVESCLGGGIMALLRNQQGLRAVQDRDSWTIHDRLTSACMEGNFTLAESLIPGCSEFPADYAPNPLHWIIMFPIDEAKKLLKYLLAGSDGLNGICRLVLDASCEDRINVPELCLELFGTPMHWATRCGYQNLVSELIHYGADINKRWNSKLKFHLDPHNVRFPSFSPLDVAVTYHFADIVELLLNQGAATFGGDIQWQYSAAHMIGQMTITFARYVAHGSKCRDAVEQTIVSLRDKGGLDLNGFDSVGGEALQTPLICAASNLDLEPYILEALLNAGASARGRFKPEDGNIATLVARGPFDRRYASKNLALLLDRNQVEDINELDSHGRNALHYCAIANGADMTQLLLAQPGIELNCRASDEGENTALLFAVKLSSCEVARLLIDGHADMEMEDAKGNSPLNSAVSSRNVDIAQLLIEGGAECNFEQTGGKCKENILHVAVINGSNRPSVAKQIIDLFPDDRIADLINSFNSGGWTPLHVAAYFGDTEGVTALLKAGADRNRFKIPQYSRSLTSLGGTPLQLTTRLLEKIEKQGLGSDHDAIKREGHAAEVNLVDRLKDILRLLEE